MSTTRLCPSCGKPLEPSAPKGLCQECLLRAGFPSETDAGEPKSLFVPPTIDELAAKFPQLEVLELIGRGGMGAVYKARQKQLGRIVALKILPPGVGDQPAFAERFTREARALAALNHPGIVTLYEFGQANGLFFFLMEFVDGVNLGQLLNTRRISAREALSLVPQICDALQYAHDQGIIHRDIKPENILVDRRGHVKVADFGVAKLVAEAGTAGSRLSAAAGAADARGAGPSDASTIALTDAGKVMGTPQYMAPEQKEHPTEVDHRADIYSLGVVFYQMLTGELPVKPIEPPSRKVHIDVRFDEVVLRALANEPERRYQQASAFKTQVETIAAAAARLEAAAKTAVIGQNSPAQSAGPAAGGVFGTLIVGGVATLVIFLAMIAASTSSVWSKVGRYFVLGFSILALAIFAELIVRVYRARKMGTAEGWRAVKGWVPAVVLTMMGIGLGLWLPMPSRTGSNPAQTQEQAAEDAGQLSEEGWSLWREQRFAAAAEKFSRAVQLDPNDANAWNGLGWTKFNSGKPAEAVPAFKKAVKLQPNHPAALNGLGQIYLAQRKYDLAETNLLKAAPQAPAAWYGLARLYLLEGKFDQAEQWARKLIDSGQGDETAQKMLEAAEAKHLNDGLRILIEPPPQPFP